MLTTPSGTSDTQINSPSRIAGSGVCSAGFKASVLPKARAGATFQLIVESGPFFDRTLLFGHAALISLLLGSLLLPNRLSTVFPNSCARLRATETLGL